MKAAAITLAPIGWVAVSRALIKPASIKPASIKQASVKRVPIKPGMTGTLALWLLLAAAQAAAHGGGLNAAGCHHDRKRGDYHCHRGAGSSDRNAYSAETDAASRAQRQGLAPLRASSARDSGVAYYRNCAAARAAGAAPVRRGDPGYAPHLDRDNDGKGCE